MSKDHEELIVAVGTYHVSPEPMILVADLNGALALCLHDEGRAVGGLLHLDFIGATGKPLDVTDNTLSSILVVLDRFKRAVLGNSVRRDNVQARILAHAARRLFAGWNPCASTSSPAKAESGSAGPRRPVQSRTVRVRATPPCGGPR